MLNAVHQPLRFEPFFRPMIWGGRSISRFLGKNLPTGDACGESWEVSDHPIHVSRLATSSLFGVTLRRLMQERAADLLGPAVPRSQAGAWERGRFPWLIKLLDVQDRLSVQVHPDEEAVKKLWPDESAKTEAWYILDAKPESRIYAGLKPNVGPREFALALERGTIADCLDRKSTRLNSSHIQKSRMPSSA